MSGVFRRNEGAFAPASDESPPVIRLLPVMMTAQTVEQVEGRDLGLGEVLAVVVLQSGPGGAPFGSTGGMQEVEGRPLESVGAAPVVVHAH